jgi:hypothetical protein
MHGDSLLLRLNAPSCFLAAAAALLAPAYPGSTGLCLTPAYRKRKRPLMSPGQQGLILTIIGLVVAVFLIWLAVKWLAFPVEVSNKLSKLIAEVERTNSLLGKMAAVSDKPETSVSVPERPAPVPKPLPRSVFSCELCGGEINSKPTLDPVMCPHCYEETRLVVTRPPGDPLPGRPAGS